MRAEAGTLDAGRNGQRTSNLQDAAVYTHAERRNATITRARPVAGVLRLRLYPIGAA